LTTFEAQPSQYSPFLCDIYHDVISAYSGWNFSRDLDTARLVLPINYCIPTRERLIRLIDITDLAEGRRYDGHFLHSGIPKRA